jgi:hypothetical protein
MIFNGFVLAYNEHYRAQVKAQDQKDFELRNRKAGSPQAASNPNHHPEGLASVGGMTVHSVSTDNVNISINPLEAAQVTHSLMLRCYTHTRPSVNICRLLTMFA